MGWSRWGRQEGGGRRGTTGAGLALTAASAVGIGLLAGCGTASSSTASSAAQGTTATASAASSASAATGPATSGPATSKPATTGPAGASPSTSSAFVPITEPFDPGHAARATSGPADCAGQQTTLAISQCYDDKTETADAAIDAAQQASFATATVAQETAMNAADKAWLAARPTVCKTAYNAGGTIDEINIASCLLEESTARLDAVKGITPAEAVLKSTDSPMMSDVSWYTTPEGSRIGMVDTQGDATGGVIIAWTVIAGASGFVVNPAQFSYTDGTFTDAGIIEKPNPAGVRVAPGGEYTFGIDYSTLPHDPNEASGNGGYVYAPGAPVAVWH
jgi:uncharacterized protein YecT (DUF1311 family)